MINDLKFEARLAKIDVTGSRVLLTESEDQVNVVLVNRETGEEIPQDEPIFILRGRDLMASSTIRDYHLRCETSGCQTAHIHAIEASLNRFAIFQHEKPERMRFPGESGNLRGQ